MRLLAALSTGLAVAWAVGLRLGAAPQLARARRRPARSRAVWLAQAGVPLTPAQFWTGSAALGLLALVVLSAVTGTAVVALVPAFTLAALPTVVAGRRRLHHLAAVGRAWPDGLRQITTAVAAGMSLPQALAELADRGPEPLRQAFARFPGLLRVTGPVPALELVREELADPSSDRVIEVLILAVERGGRVVTEILADLVETAVDDLRLAEEIATSELEQRINGRIVFVLPWLVLLFLTARPGPFRSFYASGGGLVVIVVAALLSALGMALLSRMGRRPIEPRVFGAGVRPAVAPLTATAEPDVGGLR